MKPNIQNELATFTKELDKSTLQAHVALYTKLMAHDDCTNMERRVFGELFKVFVMELGLRTVEDLKKTP